jgi:hypothetical protein
MSDYRVQLDPVADLAGPQLVEFFCTLGISCSVHITGYDLDTTNQIVILGSGSCGGTGAEVAAWAGGLVLVGEESQSAGHGYGYGTGMGTYLTQETYALGVPTSGVPGSQYILCWGHDPAGGLDLLNVQLDGDAELSGPDVADFACTLGEPCHFVVTGHDLHTTNRIIVLSTGNCGDSAPAVASTTWGSTFGHAMIETTDGIASATYDLGTPVVGVPGDTFKLCWAHDPSALSDFNVEIDADAELIGPNVGDLLECTLGQKCTVSLTGHKLRDSNGIVAIPAARVETQVHKLQPTLGLRLPQSRCSGR